MDSDYGVSRELSPLQKQRLQYQPELPPCLQGAAVKVEFCGTTTTADSSSDDVISRSFPHTYRQPLAHLVSASDKAPSSGTPLRVGIVFSGRPSAGGHNIVWGLYDALKAHNPKNTLLGFLRGTEGLFAQKTLEITKDVLATYKNQGGFDMLGRAKDQIRTAEQVKSSMAACKALKLDGLVIVGGVKSNTDAAYLAETFAEQKVGTKVIGVPATINGDLKNQFVEADVGFNTICKVNSQLISNLCTDALSAEKYYFFVRVMGRKASHVALECALRSNPNMLIIGEEVAVSKLTLFDITKEISDAIRARNAQGKNHGVILIPEGLAESIPELYALLHEIHSLQKQGVSSDKIAAQLTPWASALFQFLPPFFKKQLLIPPESDEESPQSQIEMEKLLAYLVEADINKRLKEGTYKGKKLAPICHFFGYQTRGSLPLKFDCDYAYALGQICHHILAAGLNGYMATVTNLKSAVSEWHCGAAPLTAMMTVKRRSKAPGVGSTAKPMIHPAPVDLKGMAYEVVKKNAESLLMDDIYTNPGPIQYDGPGSNAKAITLCLEDQDYIGRMSQLGGYLNKVESMAKPGCSQDVLKAALCSMESVNEVLSVLTNPSFSS